MDILLYILGGCLGILAIYTCCLNVKYVLCNTNFPHSAITLFALWIITMLIIISAHVIQTTPTIQDYIDGKVAIDTTYTITNRDTTNVEYIIHFKEE